MTSRPTITAFCLVVLVLLTWEMASSLSAAPCARPDLERRETGRDECLVYRLYRAANVDANPTLVVVLHGDVLSGRPANYHRRFAERTARDPRANNLVTVALVRPGYDDGDGESSSGGTDNRRGDIYAATIIDEIAAVIGKIRDGVRAGSVLLVGHSGGAAISGVLIGRHPTLATGAVLVSCPCDVGAWRSSKVGKKPWPLSESPHSWADKVPLTTTVVALTGSRDDNTLPQFAEGYVRSLRQRGVKARFELLPAVDHISALRADRVVDAVFELLSGE